MKNQKLLERIINNPSDVRFSELTTLLNAFDFQLKRVQGSHHIFKHPDIPYLKQKRES